MTVENLEIEVSELRRNTQSSIDSLTRSIGKMKAQLDGVSQSTEKLKTSANGSSGAVGKLMKSIGRIAVYRALRTALKEVTQAFSEGLKNAYQFSKAVGYELGNSMDALATKSLTMKNQLGAAFGGLLQAVQPVLLDIISLVTKAANALAALFGAFTGGQYLKAKDVATGWDEATKAAGAYKRTILGFDEINKLDEPSGGGASAKDYEDMFEIAKTPLWLNDLAIRFKDILFNFDNLNKEQIAEKILVGLGAATGGLVGFAFGGVRGAIIGTIAGIAISALITSLTFDGDGKISKTEIANSIGNVLVIAAGGLVGLAAGGLHGAAIGLIAATALVAAVTSIEFAKSEKYKARFAETSLGKLVEEVKSENDRLNDVHIDLRAKIDSITGEIDADTKINLEIAKRLIDEIFTINSGENLTSVELHKIKSDIELLNGLNLPGVFLEFDEATQKVIGTKEALQGVIDKLEEQYKLEALKESLISLYKAQIKGEIELESAEKNLRVASDARASAEKSLTEAQNKLNTASEKYSYWLNMSGLEMIQNNITFGEFFENTKNAKKGLKDATDELKLQEIALQETNSALETAQQNYQNIADDVSTASGKIDTLKGKLDNITAHPYTITVNAEIADVALTAKAAAQSGNGNAARWLAENAGRYANGGFPSRGDLFIAGEAGAELVSSYNGQTQVSNTDQIARSVYEGNGVVVRAIDDMASAVVRAINNKDMNFYLDSRQIRNGQNRLIRENG